MNSEFISRTRYFYKPWTWFKTIVIIGFIALFFLSWEINDEENKYSLIRYLIFCILVFALVTAPVDDLAIDTKHFYYLRTSILPSLSKEIKFEIAQIKSIRFGGKHTQSSDILQSIFLRGGGRNTIEIILMDDSFKSLDVAIYKGDVETVVSKVKEKMLLK